MELAPVERSSVATEIAQQLRRQILSGAVRPGERLPSERALAAQLGANRNTVREALRLLEAQGLVRARHGDGVIVLDPREHGTLELIAPFLLEAADPAEQLQLLLDVLRARRWLALEAVEAAAARAPRESERALVAAVEAVETATEPAERARRDLELFATLIDLSGRLLFRWARNALVPACAELIARAPAMWWLPDDHAEAWREVAAAIGRGDAAAARARLESFFTGVDEVLQHMAAAGGSGGFA